MLCDNCKVNQAGVHTVTIINGVKQERYLCPECATSAQFSLPSIMDLLSGVQAMQQAEQPICACGNSFARFQKTGLLGCPECYKTFENALTPVIKRAQGGKIRHVGRKPQLIKRQQKPNAAVEEAVPCGPKSECGRLREELKKAIAEERYERAAELRDRLRILEGGETS